MSDSNVPPTSDGRKRVFQGTHVAITEWLLRTDPETDGEGKWIQVIALDRGAQRTGNGYLLLSPNGARELRTALCRLLGLAI